MPPGAAFGGGVGLAAEPGGGEVAVELGEKLVQLARILAGRGCLVAELLKFGAFLQ